MSEKSERYSQGCREARRTMRDLLDGPVKAERERSLRSHVERCNACRQHQVEALEVQQQLRSIPEHRFPEEALEEVLDLTVRAERATPRSRVPVLEWRLAAAAAVLVVALLGFWVAGRDGGGPGVDRPGEPVVASAADRAAAEREIRLVLNLTADALRRTERAAVRSVLAEEVSPALRRIPVRFPELPPPERRTGT